MPENTVTIPTYVYVELVKKSERINAVERFLKSNEYVNVADIKAILDINEAKENENEII